MERFVSFVSRVLIFTLLPASPCFAANVVKPLPPPTIVQSNDANLKTAADAVTSMFVSVDYDNNHPKVTTTNVDLTALIQQAMVDFDKIKVHQPKGILLNAYEEGDPAQTQSLIAAAKNKAYASVLINTDFNTSMDAPKGEKGKFTDFSQGVFHNTPVGKATQTLLANGFKINDPNFGITSQPLWAKDQDTESPIMHEKEIYFTIGGKVARFLTGTANMTNNKRINRIFDIADFQIAQYCYNHAMGMIENFRNAGTIKDNPVVAPYRVVYPDDSFVETAFTDGKFNPNQRLSDLFIESTKNPDDYKVTEVIMGQFVFTNGTVLTALKELLDTQKTTKMTGLFDAEFVNTKGFGMAAALAGVAVNRPFGKAIVGFDPSLRERIDAYVYQRTAIQKNPGDTPYTAEVDPDGEPTGMFLEHDKTTIVKRIEKGVAWTYVFSGSLNNSAHVDNAEMQLLFRFKADAPIAISMEDSIKKFIAREPGFALPLEKGLLRGSLADLIGYETLEIPLTTLDQVAAAFATNDDTGIKQITKILSDLFASGKTKLVKSKRVSATQMQTQVQRVTEFLSWYRGEMTKQGKLTPLPIQYLINATTLATSKKISAATARQILETMTTNEDNLKTAWSKLLNIKYVAAAEVNPTTETTPVPSKPRVSRGASSCMALFK